MVRDTLTVSKAVSYILNIGSELKLGTGGEKLSFLYEEME